MYELIKHDVETLEAEFTRAIVEQDIETLDRLIAEDAIFVTPQGIVLNKAQNLALYRSGELKISTYESSEFILQAYDATTLTNSKISIVGKLDEKPFTGIYRYTRVYSKTNNQWQIISSQATAIA
ncbi:nuclear transport factor 2 family protein [Oscillatoria sp. FACHB-1407]|uniref:nuclear transport factor 2 family protein n=1 Tax=Oscillatoria sp. FACHB-1407 TaxID=2692847 RepID=UPI00168A334A|nr:nuclear transport factor 2 family protein [Oscillatoria sp. FACHB-1407]MBD2459477.1 nuclear transport factor 2 family protein [Oscillatoria sp. FACHB-1407]